jgi:hypothetical protein
LLDFPPDPIIFVGRKPQVRLRRIEDLKRGTNKDIGPKDIFEMGSIKFIMLSGNKFNFNTPIKTPSFFCFIAGQKILGPMAYRLYFRRIHTFSNEIALNHIGPIFRYHFVVGRRSD